MKNFLSNLGLLEIDGFQFKKRLGGGSALSSLYIRGDEKAVFKFLIAPRNLIELERFKLEYSVLEKNKANSVQNTEGFKPDERVFLGPKTSYPLPRITLPLTSKFSNLVNYFAYSYEDGLLLSLLDTSKYSIEEKISLLYRLASGLNYFNQTGYSHRDLHPENILLLDDYSMPDITRHGSVNDPRVKILDMGNCQRINLDRDFIDRINRNLNEDEVFQDNNRRILTSFVSMAPDFLEKGEETKNYDTWSFGIYAYKLLFNKMPCITNQIGDITSLRKQQRFSDNYLFNLESLPLGLNLVLKQLLSSNGDERPSIDAIVRLFSWLVFHSERFKDRDFIIQVINENGFDPNYDFRDDYC